MTKTLVYYCLRLWVLQAATFLKAEAQEPACEEDPTYSERLLLTPLIGNGSDPAAINKALNLSQVHALIDGYNIIAHSGYITVNETTNNSLFFLFIKAQKTRKETPLVLSLKGGPGVSTLFNQFLETGPLGIDAMGQTFHRNYTLQKDMHLLYLDVPAGSGFSFVNENGYSTKLEDVVRDVEAFFEQFYNLFPELAWSPFYISGEQYGGRMGVMIANELMKKRPNFKGVIIGNIFLGPMIEVIDPSEFLLCSKMINEAQRDMMYDQFEKVRKLIGHGKFREALVLLFSIVLKNKARPWKTLFQNLTGYDYQANVLYDLKPPEFPQYGRYANSTNFKIKIHAGEKSVLDETRGTVLNKLVPTDFNRDITKHFLDLIESGKRVIFFAGQLNTVLTADHLEGYIERVVNMSNIGSLGPQMPWYNEDARGRTKIAGYVRSAGNFSFVILGRAGQHGGFDESANYCELIRRAVFRHDFLKESPLPGC